VNTRVRILIGVLVVVVIAAVGGFLAGRSIRSPADEAASREAPAASRITVPVERRELSSNVVFRGTIRYAEPTPVSLAGTVGGTSTSNTVTVAPVTGTTLADGDVIMEVTGRPVFAMQGAEPMYRPITPGSTGNDVTQLEEALVRFGFDPGPVDGTYDDRTEAAIDAWYQSKGYESQGPTTEQRSSLRTQRESVTQAEQSVRDAQKSLGDAQRGPTQSEILERQNGVTRAEQEIETAELAARTQIDMARADVAQRARERDEAIAARDAAEAKLVAAQQVGAVNPDTTLPYTAEEIQALSSDAQAKRSAVTAAQSALDLANLSVTTAQRNGEISVQNARDALTVAQAQLAEANAPRDVA
jgi:hypothetical protein